jgi:hypothetical protein
MTCCKLSLILSNSKDLIQKILMLEQHLLKVTIIVINFFIQKNNELHIYLSIR